MSSQVRAPLRFVDHRKPDSLTFERRSHPRHVIRGHVTAVRSDPQDGNEQRRICALELLNLSDGGLGALAQEPVAIDAKITVFFPPHGPERGLDLTGRVVRCTQREHGYDVGIRMTMRYAA